jgi:hypothetical protein
LRLGDYDDKGKLPYAPMDFKNRAKKYFRRFEVCRLRSFYGVFDDRGFKQNLYKVLGQYKTNAAYAASVYLEGRPIFLLYLTHLFPSIYFVDQFIKQGQAYINNKVCIDVHYPLCIGDIMTIETAHY